MPAMNRRQFVHASAAGALGSALARTAAAATSQPASGDDDRSRWTGLASKLATPVLSNLARGTLRQAMPVEEAAGANRAPVTHLEAVGRLLAGLAPWLALPAEGSEEGRERARLIGLTREGLARGLDPASPDALNFTEMRQPLVDAAFLAQAVLRAPGVLADGLDARLKAALVAALESSRVILPVFNNWLLFSATVEAGLRRLGARWDRMRVDYALRQHEQWYKGDGAYGDGPAFHWDYYNSFVIHPMLVDLVETLADEQREWAAMRETILRRAVRHAAVLERLISPEGTFPPIGRSLAYRCGAFQGLAQMALRRSLPAGVPPGQARAALSAVIRRSMEAPGTFDAAGWLRIGFAGHQPGIGERYISTGSLYLCATALLPLGLPADDPFWTAPAEPWTARRAWSGQPFPIDAAL